MILIVPSSLPFSFPLTAVPSYILRSSHAFCCYPAPPRFLFLFTLEGKKNQSFFLIALSWNSLVSQTSSISLHSSSPQNISSKHLGNCHSRSHNFQALLIGPSENRSIIWFANILKPWLPARSNFYFVKNTWVAWFPFIINKSQLQLGSGIRSFSGNKSLHSHLLNTDPVVKLGNKNYYPYLLSLSTKKIYFPIIRFMSP